MKRRFTLLLVASLFAGLGARAAFNLPQDAEGYYLISTPEDLVAFSDYVNNTVNANSAWGRLTADIDMSGVPNFWPIGMYADIGGTQVKFVGHFDGAGHVIKNLVVAREDNYEVGLFSRCQNAVIENLGIVNANMSTTSQMERNGNVGVRVGVITGEFVSSVMRNCWTAGTIELSTSHPQKGYISGEAASNSQFINCFSTGDILVNGSAFSLTNCFGGEDVEEIGPTGELCFLLNGDQSKIRWYQTLGEDEVPCQDPTHKQVYGNGPKNCDGSSAGALTYSNTDDGSPVPPHQYDAEGYCQNCGFEGFEVTPSIDHWYEVTTPQELRWVSRFVNKGSNTISIRLMNDLDMSEIPNFPPMGKHRDSGFGADDVNFRGTFDGQYHVIRNLYIEADDNYEAGFFGRTQGATVRNVAFVDATVINNSPGPVRAGVVGGEIYQSTVTNVWTAGNLSVSTAHNQCAGFAGEGAQSTFNNCWSTYEGLFMGTSSTTLNNCRYYDQNNDIALDAESGALCWALNGKSFDPSKVSYYQTLGEDQFPTWDKTHGLVYSLSEGEYQSATTEEEYQDLVSNVILAEHEAYAEVMAPASLIDSYLDRVDALENSSFTDFLAAYNNLQGMRDAITAATSSYEKYQAALAEVQAYVDENSDFFDGAERDLLINYLTKEIEPGDVYPNGSSLYILANRNLNSNYVNSEIGYVQQLLSDAVQHGYAPGADISTLLTNANFADGTAGWTTAGSIATHTTAAEVTKYLLQGQNGKFEVSQTLKGLKDGLYEFRLGGYSEVSNGLLIGTYNYRNLIFANDNANYQKTLFSDLLTEDEVDGYAGFEEKSDELGNPIGWKPNNVTGVGNAIDLNHWDNRVIVQVTDGELTVGMKGGSPYKLSNSDFMGNARLRYLGEMESDLAVEAMTALLEDVRTIITHMTEDFVPDILDYKEAPNYYNGYSEELKACIADIDKAATGAEKYAVLSKLRDLFERINNSKLIYSELREMADELLDVYGIQAPEKLEELQSSTIDPVIDMFYSGDGTDQQVEASIDRLRNDDIYKVIRGHEPEEVDGVYQLADAYNLVWFSAQSNAGGRTNMNAVLVNDIDMSEIANFTPIVRHRDDTDWDGDGTADGVGIGATYSGTFDGQGHVIKNLTIIVEDGCEAGLFSRAQEAVIKNVGFVNATVKNTRTYNNDTQGVRAGVLAGEAYKCNIMNCYSVGDIVVETLHEQCNGLCGEAASSSVQGCYTTFAGAAVSGGSQMNVYGGEEAAPLLKTGELAYRLNGDQSAIAFYQTLGTDDYPILDPTHKQVYGHGTIACDGGVTENTTFDNEPGNEAVRLEHVLADGICENCGFDAGVITDVVDGYFLIANPYNLRWFSKYVNANNGGANARLVADIDMKDINDFRPISRYSDDGNGPDGVNVTYSGTFDGDFHVIRNLHMEFNQRIEGGLFGRMTSGGVVKNLGMENVSIKNTHSNGCRIGCVVGENNGGTVQNVYTIGNIEIETFHAQKCGIAGEAANGSIVNCYTTWNVLQTRGTESNCFAGEDVAKMGPSGELCYKMNKGVVNNPTWRQTLGTENYPTFNKESKVVYQLGDSYSNEIPVLASYAGTEEDPFVIKKAEDLQEIRKYLNQGQMNYIVLDSDIDMSGIENWTPLNTDIENYLFYINFDGRGHVIRNFAPKNTDLNYQSFFGILCGGVRNVGFEDADVTCTPTGSAIVAAWAGRTASYSDSTFIDHVYVTGKLNVSGYVGALVGSVNGITGIRNCYVNVDITGSSTLTGGVVGRINDALTMENVYAAGTMNRGGGIVGGGMTATTPPATYKNVVVWNNDYENFGTTSVKDKLSGLSFYNGSNFAALQQTVVGWDSKVWSCDMAEGSYPVLVYDPNGLTPTFAGTVVRDNAVYTLSGVKVAENANALQRLPKGIYLVGGKKALVK